METTVIGLSKARQRIRLSDEPDSPEFVLDLTSTALGKNLTAMVGLARRYVEISERREAAAEEGNEHAIVAALRDTAEVYRGIITIMLGKDAWEQVLAYVGDGEPIELEEASIAIAPLAGWLLNRFNEILGVTRRKAAAKYLEPTNDPDAI